MLNFTSLRLILCFENTQLIYSIVDPYPPPEPIVQLIVGIVDPCPPPADCCVPLPPSHPSESPTDAPADSPRDAPGGNLPRKPLPMLPQTPPPMLLRTPLPILRRTPLLADSTTDAPTAAPTAALTFLPSILPRILTRTPLSNIPPLPLMILPRTPLPNLLRTPLASLPRTPIPILPPIFPVRTWAPRPHAGRTATGRRGHKSIGTWLGRVEVEGGHPTPPAWACHQVQFEHPPRAPVPQLLPLLRGRPALPREHARPAALAACSLPRRTIPHAVPRASLTSRRAVRPTGRHVQSKFNLNTRRAPRSRSFSLFSADMPARPP